MPQEVDLWVDQKIARGEVRLYLDALDELISLDAHDESAVTPRPCNSRVSGSNRNCRQLN